MKAKRGALKGATSPDGMACRKALQPIIRFRASCAPSGPYQTAFVPGLAVCQTVASLDPEGKQSSISGPRFPKAGYRHRWPADQSR